MDSEKLIEKVDEIVEGINVYGQDLFTKWVAKEIVEALEFKEDSISIERLLLVFRLAKSFSKKMEDEQKLEELNEENKKR